MSPYSADKESHRFDQWSETYEHSMMQWLIFNHVHRAVLSQLPNGFSPRCLLDIGCGTGRLLRKMVTRWPSATLVGIDPSEGMVSQARLLTPGAAIYQASAEEIPLEDGSMDLVTSTMSFHHWSNQANGVAEVTRVLNRGGIFILADTNIGHGHPLSRPQVKALFTACSLSVKSQKSIVPFLTVTTGIKT